MTKTDRRDGTERNGTNANAKSTQEEQQKHANVSEDRPASDCRASVDALCRPALGRRSTRAARIHPVTPRVAHTAHTHTNDARQTNKQTTCFSLASTPCRKHMLDWTLVAPRLRCGALGSLAHRQCLIPVDWNLDGRRLVKRVVVFARCCFCDCVVLLVEMRIRRIEQNAPAATNR